MPRTRKVQVVQRFNVRCQMGVKMGVKNPVYWLANDDIDPTFISGFRRLGSILHPLCSPSSTFMTASCERFRTEFADA